MFGERLKLARKRHGLSMRALADRLDKLVSAQAIGKYERGEMMPSSTVLIALVKSLDVSLSYLMSTSGIALDAVEFRKRSSATTREKAMVEAEVLDHMDRYVQVETFLGLDAGAWGKPHDAPYKVIDVSDIEFSAEALRSAWNLGTGPISNLTELLEERGIKVLKLDLPVSLDGLTCIVRGTGGLELPVIVCSSRKSNERQRFTLAHELGHLVMAVSSGLDEEKACNRFAGAFLAPKAELVKQVGISRRRFGVDELVEVKQLFGISAASLVMRMRDLGIIGKTTMQQIFSGFGRNWRKREPRPIDREETPRRFRRLCLRALAEDEISESKAAELLQEPIGQIGLAMSGYAR